MSISQQRCIDSARKFGIEKVYPFGPQDISREFYELNKAILDTPRGAGLWLWKSYFIMKVLLESNPGDIVIYSDAGQTFINDPQHIIDVMGDQDIFLFTNGFLQHEWTKMDVMKAINGTQMQRTPTMSGDYFTLSEEMLNQKQVQASLIFIRVTEKSKAFFKEFYLWCQMPGLIDDSKSKEPNSPTFADHRHDQSILSAMSAKYKIGLHWFPSTTGHHLGKGEDNYPELIWHNRKRNAEW